MTNPQDEISSIDLPKVDTSAIIAAPQVQTVIAQEMQKWDLQWQKIEQFLKDGLERLFANQNSNIEQINQIFAEVVELDKVKQSTKDVINFYEGYDSEVVNTTLKTMDNDLNEIKPLVAKLKDSIDGSVWFIKRLLFGGEKKLFLSSLQGIAGRIDSLDFAFEKTDENLKKNEYVLSTLIPEIGVRIAKIDAMIAALQTIVSTLEDEKAVQLLKTLIDELTNMSWIQKESLSRLTLLAVMNGNSKLVLQSTRVEVFMGLQPLIVENIVGGNQKKVYEMRQKARAWLNALREWSKKNIEDIMHMEHEDKLAFKQRLEEISNNIDWVIQKSKTHQTNMQQAQRVIDEYMPWYKQKVTELENGIYETATQMDSFSQASSTIIDKLKSEEKELVAKAE